MTLNLHKRWLQLAVSLLLVGAVSCAAPPERETSHREPAQQERGARPRGSATYQAQAIPELFPKASDAASGWDSERLWSQHVDWEPVVTADPVTPDIYQLTTRYYAPECPGCPDPSIVFRRSVDGGATWGPDSYLSRRGQELADPQIAVAVDGTLYAAYLQDWWPGAVLVRSRNRGKTWSRPVSPLTDSDLEWSDKPILTISSDGRDVYLAFNSNDSYVAASHDFGRSFSAPVRTNRDSRTWFHTDGVVATDGTVYIAATDYKLDLAGRSHISILRSTDEGTSWETIRVDTSEGAPRCRWWAPGCYSGFLGPSVAVAADTSGLLMVVYNAGTESGEPQRLWMRTSQDGLDWSRRKRISRAHRWVNNAFPAAEAGSLPGDFRVVWQDDRKTRPPRDTNEVRWWNTWYRSTTDGGATWSKPIRLSNRGERTIYKSRRGYGFPYGDYLWLAVDGTGTNHVIWGEGESLSGNGGTWLTRGR